MVADIDISRSAALLIKQHGTTAWLEAAAKYRELLAREDYAGATAWRRIAAAIAQFDDVKHQGQEH